MVHPYLRRRAGHEEVIYPDERVRQVLHKTLGVPIFQEQAMRLAVVAAGFTPGEADQLRRAMGAWRRPGVIDQFQKKLLHGMQSRGYTREFAEQVFRQIRGFGEYGFPESHAASFALLVYVSAWLKRYYPAAFTAALLNSQPMGFYAPAQLVADARRHGIEVRPIDVNHSHWDCTLEAAGNAPGAAAPRWAIRLGLRMIGGLRQAHAMQLVRARGQAPFSSLDEVARRAGLGGAVLARLARADAFASMGLNRRTALWQALPQPEPARLLEGCAPDEPAAHLPALCPAEEVVADYRTKGLSLRAHPLSFLRRRLAQQRVVTAASLGQLRDGCRVRVAGIVLMRQRPSTASGITFVTLEDETGFANLIVRPEIWERWHRVARRAQGMIAFGTLQRKDQVIHILAEKLVDLATLPADAAPASRDFR
jgi:error-prone DNA polymerase